MRGRPPNRRVYAWPQAHRDLESGIHPEVVALRLGVHVDAVRVVADQQGWAIAWRGPDPDTVIDRYSRLMGLE